MTAEEIRLNKIIDLLIMGGWRGTNDGWELDFGLARLRVDRVEGEEGAFKIYRVIDEFKKQIYEISSEPKFYPDYSGRYGEVDESQRTD